MWIPWHGFQPCTLVGVDVDPTALSLDSTSVDVLAGVGIDEFVFVDVMDNVEAGGCGDEICPV